MASRGLVWLAMAGAAALTLIAPQSPAAQPRISSPVRRLSSQLQPAIDQLLDAQHQVTDTVSGYSFISPAQVPLADVYTQNLFATTLAIALGQVNVRFAGEANRAIKPDMRVPVLRVPATFRPALAS